MPVDLFAASPTTEGSAYELDLTPANGPEWISQINLRPVPPDGIRWLEVAAPPGPAVRVNLDPASGPPGGEPVGGAPEISPANLSAGEQLLIMLAEELLMAAARFPLAMPPAFPPRAVLAMGTGLGDIIAGLGAVDVLSPLSPVAKPGWRRCAPACASAGTGSRPRQPMTCRNPG